MLGVPSLALAFLGNRKAAHPADAVVGYDFSANPIPHLDEQMIGASFKPVEGRSPEHVKVLQASDALIAEPSAADVITPGVSVYSFSNSSTLKAWSNHVWGD
ncbi:NAD(P)H-dependent oxidoreductase [Burkholderia sp. PU8-34]